MNSKSKWSIDVFYGILFQLPAPASNGPSLSVTLYYLPALRFVSVHTQLIDFDAEGIAARYAFELAWEHNYTQNR